MVDVKPHTVIMVDKSQHCMVLLKEVAGSRLLPIWMRVLRARPIALYLQGIRPRRPQSHDLLIEVTERLGGRMVRATLHRLEADVLLGTLFLSWHGQEIPLECAASDAIIVAAKQSLPITVPDEIMEVAGFRPGSPGTDVPGTELELEDKNHSAFHDFIEGLDLTGL